MGQPQPLFCLFSIFSNKQSNFYNKSMWKMSKCPSSILRRDSSLRPFDHESSPITTRPWLPPFLHLFLQELYLHMTHFMKQSMGHYFPAYRVERRTLATTWSPTRSSTRGPTWPPSRPSTRSIRTSTERKEPLTRLLRFLAFPEIVPDQKRVSEFVELYLLKIIFVFCIFRKSVFVQQKDCLNWLSFKLIC